MPVTPSPILEAAHVRKAYGGVRALDDVSLALLPGEIHALVGENGAGKSTLIKILSGSVRPDAGRVAVAGKPLPLGGVAASQAAGIATIHQESTAFPFLSAEDNLFVGREPRRGPGGLLLDRARMRSETRALLARLGMDGVDTRRPVGELSLASRQMVSMARALSRESRILILDEPTASLSAREANALFAVLRRLQAEGVGLLYVSHRLDEVFALADRVTILRDGNVVDTCSTKALSRDELIRKMVGRPVGEIVRTVPVEAPPAPNSGGARVPFNAGVGVMPNLSDTALPPPPELGAGGASLAAAVVLDVRNLTRTGAFADVSFSVRAGEIVGLAGLVGAGRSEVARAIFGVDRPTGGSVFVDGNALPPGRVESAIARGVALVPEDRQSAGLVLPLSVGENLVLGVLRRLTSRGGFRSRRRESDEVITPLWQKLAVRAASASVPAETLSGGNQQKIVLGKWLATKPSVLLLDEPTRGVDVGAKAEVYALLRTLASEGLATLVISSDLPELLALSDRIIVLRAGRIAGELPRAQATEETVLSLAFGPGGDEHVP